MSVHNSTYLVLGIEIHRGLFFAPTGVKKYECRGNGHQVEGNYPPFCARCGQPILETEGMTARPLFQAWAEKLNMKPEEAWLILFEKEGMWAPRYHELGIHRVGAIESSDYKTGALALGFKLLHQDSERGSHGRGDVNTVGLGLVQEKASVLETVARELQLTPLPKLFVTFYSST